MKPTTIIIRNGERLKVFLLRPGKGQKCLSVFTISIQHCTAGSSQGI